MAEPQADTHGMVVTGAGPTAADTDAIISGAGITLPAGGPWEIFYVWVQSALATATAAESQGGFLQVVATAGDLEPNPAPFRLPVAKSGSFLGAVHDVGYSPLILHEVNWKAPGKSQIQLVVQEPTAVTVAAQYAAGIIFGKTRPKMKPFTYIDQVEGNITAAAETSIGTITLAEKAKQITAVCAVIAQDGVLTTAEELIGFITLASDDVKMPPMQLPLSAAFDAGLGATIANIQRCIPVWIPVVIPIVGGARINCFLDLNTAVTNAASVQVFIAYE